MLQPTQQYNVLITCPPGLYPWLQEEVREAELPIVWAGNTGVETLCTFHEIVKLNCMLRTGHRVLLRLKEFECKNPEQLYNEIYALPWHESISSSGYLSVTSTVQTDSIRDTRYPNLKVKDAIVDRIAKETGARPNSGPERNGVVVHLYWKGAKAAIYIDTSGEPLSRRSYRKIPGPAPMQETLAAAVTLATGWDPATPFVNPMCGSGTIAIEAALIATGRYPGLLRPNFGFLHLKDFDRSLLDSVRKELKNRTSKKTPPTVIASDISARAIDAARRNATTAGVQHLIDFQECDFAATPLPDPHGTIVMNPEYGIRLGNESELIPLYERIGMFFREKCEGWQCCVFSGSPTLSRKVGLKPKHFTKFFNATIKCTLSSSCP
jgi:putative N6-adenine-specific DNA methylase